jgi:hypothetical protein
VVELSRQAEATFRAWMEAQRAVWDTWLEASRGLSQASSAEDRRREIGKLVDQWEKSVRTAMDIPVDQTRRLVETLSQEERVPREAIRLAEQTHRIVREWRDAQRPLWDAWVAMARQLGAGAPAGNWEDVVETWRTAAHQAANAQAEWARRVAPGAAEETERTARPKPPQASRSKKASSPADAPSAKPSSRKRSS